MPARLPQTGTKANIPPFASSFPFPASPPLAPDKCEPGSLELWRSQQERGGKARPPHRTHWGHSGMLWAFCSSVESPIRVTRPRKIRRLV